MQNMQRKKVNRERDGVFVKEKGRKDESKEQERDLEKKNRTADQGVLKIGAMLALFLHALPKQPPTAVKNWPKD